MKRATGVVRFERLAGEGSRPIRVRGGTRIMTQSGIVIETLISTMVEADQPMTWILCQAAVFGAAGNVAAETAVYLIDAVPGIERVSNPTAFTGGA